MITEEWETIISDRRRNEPPDSEDLWHENDHIPVAGDGVGPKATVEDYTKAMATVEGV